MLKKTNTQYFFGILTFTFVLLIICPSCTKDISKIELSQQFPIPKYETMNNLFNSLDSASLYSVVLNKNDFASKQLLHRLSININNFVSEKYLINLSAVTNDFNVVIIGMLIAEKELETQRFINKINNIDFVNTPNKAAGMDCFLSSVSGVLGILEARALYMQFTNGVGAETIIAAVKLIGKRVGSAISIVFAVYELGLCIGWWPEISA
jgi:hypothetical protein